VVSWLLANSDRPKLAVHLWAKMLLRLYEDGEVIASRENLAAAVGTSPGAVSRIMTALAAIGAITRTRMPLTAKRGPGMVSYYVNPRIATVLTGEERERAQAAAPPLRI
jgi:hypothetical protein